MEKKKILSSWKEISNYLGIRVRTAQRWESEIGLPIHRIEKLNKTYVIAYIDEIDNWIKNKTQPKSNNKPAVLKYILTVLFTAIVISAAFLIPKSHPTSEIFSYKIEDTHLVITDKNEKRLWDHYLSPRLNKIEFEEDWPKKNVQFKDIDNDGKPNVIVAIQNQDNFDEEIVCFDHKGNQLWRRKIGKEILYGDKTFSSDFDIARFKLEDLDGDSRDEIAVIACHKIYFPCRFMILNSSGDLIGEYWNAGHLNTMAFADLNDDRKKEIILGGVNNNYRKACLAVFDLAEVQGSSPQIKGTRYFSPVLGPGSEKYYLLLPQNVVGQTMFIQENVRSIDLLTNKRFDLTSSISRIHFEFDRNMVCTDVYLGDEFILNFNKLKQEGKLAINLDDIDTEKLRSEIVYWNEGEWLSKSAIAK